jgi:phosphate/sulfate permease
VAATIERTIPSSGAINDKLARKTGTGPIIIFGLILAAGLFYVASHLASDLSVEHETSIQPYLMLAGALLIALGFEFVNGFHDTANAVTAGVARGWICSRGVVAAGAAQGRQEPAAV